MAGDGVTADSLRLAEEFSGAGNQAWSERTDLQVQKMEQTIEQDLANAMVGLREQFRQHPQFGGRPGPGPVAAQAAGPEVPTGSGVLQPEAAALTDFRSEAAAARDEMLDGLARLRRELEVQRLQQGSSLPGHAASESSRQQLQVAAVEVVVGDLRRNMSAQQGALADLRREVLAQSEYSKRCTTMLDREVQRLTGELEFLRDQRPPAPAEEESCGGPRGGTAALREELRSLAERLERLEQLFRSSAEERAAVGRCLGVVSEMDQRLESVSSALEAERQARAARPAEEGAAEISLLWTEMNTVRQEVSMLSAAIMGELPGLGQDGQELERTRRLSPEELGRLREALGGARAPGMVNEVMEDLKADHERKSADLEELQRRCEETQQSSMASLREIAEGLLLECSSRQAQVSELRRSLADDISSSMEAAREALRADVSLQCRELRKELGAHLEALERELRCLGAQCGDACRVEKEDEIAARVAAIEAEVSRNLAAMGQHGDGQGSDPQGAHQRRGHVPVGFGEEANSLVDADQVSVEQRPLISRGLKESLEQLVDKVQRTLLPGPDIGAAGAEAQAAPLSAARVLPPQLVVETLQGCSAAAGPVRPNSPRRRVTAPGSVSFPVEGPRVVIGGSGTQASSAAAATPPLLFQPQAALLTMLSRPPPVAVLPAPSAAEASSPSVQGSAAGSFAPDASGGGSPEHGLAEAEAGREASFRRCLRELREENRALRGQAPAGPAAPASSASVSFPVAAPQHLWTVAGTAGAFYGGHTVVIPSSGNGVRMTPGPLYRTISPVGGQQRAVSPTPAIRRNLSPQR